MRTSVNTWGHKRGSGTGRRGIRSGSLGTNLVEDGVTDAEDVHDDAVFQQGQEVVGHSLPEVEEEVLDLEQQQFHQLARTTVARAWPSAGAEVVTSSKFTLMALSRMHWQ